MATGQLGKLCAQRWYSRSHVYHLDWKANWKLRKQQRHLSLRKSPRRTSQQDSLRLKVLMQLPGLRLLFRDRPLRCEQSHLLSAWAAAQPALAGELFQYHGQQHARRTPRSTCS